MGEGEGEIDGQIALKDCNKQGTYHLDPNFFSAEPREERLDILLQHGSDLQIRSDGMFIYIDDASALQNDMLEQPLTVDDGLWEAVLFLNETCPVERRKTPVSLYATSGTITFNAIYAPEEDKDAVSIDAVLDALHFENSETPDDNYADLSGYFRFIYNRGKPAQRFP